MNIFLSIIQLPHCLWPMDRPPPDIELFDDHLAEEDTDKGKKGMEKDKELSSLASDSDSSSPTRHGEKPMIGRSHH